MTVVLKLDLRTGENIYSAPEISATQLCANLEQ